jgi:hypothetical protein
MAERHKEQRMRGFELLVVRRVSIEPFIILCVSEETMEAWPNDGAGGLELFIS